MEITEQTYDGTPGTGPQYFRTSEGSLSGLEGSRRQCSLFAAIEFKEDDAYFLAGPFEFNGKYYGLVSLFKGIELKPIEQVKQEFFKNKDLGINYLDYGPRKRITDLYGEGCKYYSARSDGKFYFYSELDLKFGASEIDPKVLSALKEDEEQCGLFFKTQGAYQKIAYYLTSSEIQDWRQKVEESYQSCWAEIQQTNTFEEIPYTLKLQGTDDCSWTQNFASKEEALDFIDKMKKVGSLIVKEMQFTN